MVAKDLIVYGWKVPRELVDEIILKNKKEIFL